MRPSSVVLSQRGPRRISISSGVMIAAVSSAFALWVLAPAADAAGGANFIATGHDMDYHCTEPMEAEERTEECAYLKIVVDKVRNGSTLPILALDQGTQVPRALADAGFTGAGEVVAVDPAETATFDATPFVSAEGKPLYSAIVTASDERCGGCDDNELGESNINARAADFKTFFNAGGGILALAAADQYKTYYDFAALTIGATVDSPPFTVTPAGEALGITPEEANCCATHNSFLIPAPPLVVLEDDDAGMAETIGAFGVKITDAGFGTLTTELSGGGTTGESITVNEGTPVSDQAFLAGEHSGEARGDVEYEIYETADCTSAPVEAGVVNVSAGSIPASEAVVLPPGTWYWQASYTGDSHNPAAKSACGEEVLTVSSATPVTTTSTATSTTTTTPASTTTTTTATSTVTSESTTTATPITTSSTTTSSTTASTTTTSSASSTSTATSTTSTSSSTTSSGAGGPVVERVVPELGPVHGGTVVRILGRGLAPEGGSCELSAYSDYVAHPGVVAASTGGPAWPPRGLCGTTVSFGGVPALVLSDGGSEVVVVSPRHHHGTVTVTVTVNGLSSTVASMGADDFTYFIPRRHRECRRHRYCRSHARYRSRTQIYGRRQP